MKRRNIAAQAFANPEQLVAQERRYRVLDVEIVAVFDEPRRARRRDRRKLVAPFVVDDDVLIAQGVEDTVDVGVDERQIGAALPQFVDHEQQAQIREERVLIAAADVAMDAGHPDLLDRLGLLAAFPEQRLEIESCVVDREDMHAVLHALVEQQILESESLEQLSPPHRTGYRIPDADEFDFNAGMNAFLLVL